MTNCGILSALCFCNCCRPIVHCCFVFFFRWQVSSIEQEILSLINRVSHPNLTHYLAVNVQESAPTVNVQVMSSRLTCNQARNECLSTLAVNMFGLLTKCEVKMAGYWPSSFFCAIMDLDKVEVQKVAKKNEANIRSSWPNKLGQ